MSERNPISGFEVEIGRNIREWRKKRSMTLVELSERLTAIGRPMNKGWLSKIERGVDDAPPSSRLIFSLAHVLSIPPAVLLLPAEPAQIVMGYVEKGGLAGAMLVIAEMMQARSQ